MKNEINACYDEKEDKIFNAKKGSIAWWHERGHQYIYRCGYGAMINGSMNASLFGLLASIIFDAPELWQITFFITYFTACIIEEIWAWIYAIKHRNMMIC